MVNSYPPPERFERIRPKGIPAAVSEYDWLKDVRIWRQGELDYTCGLAALMTAALCVKAISYGQCDFNAWAKRQHFLRAQRALTRGISYRDLLNFAETLPTKLTATSKPEFEGLKIRPRKVWIVLVEASYKDPYECTLSGPYNHLIVVFGKDAEERLLVGDPHPWSGSPLSWVRQEDLEIPKLAGWNDRQYVAVEKMS